MTVSYTHLDVYKRQAVEALKTGALDYLIKPLDFDNLQATLEKALVHTHSIDAETPAVSASQFGMVGKSPAMQHLLSDCLLYTSAARASCPLPSSL